MSELSHPYMANKLANKQTNHIRRQKIPFESPLNESYIKVTLLYRCSDKLNTN